MTYEVDNQSDKVVVQRHVSYTNEFEFKKDSEGFLITPDCPGCSFSAVQQKCPWELGGACERHDTKDAFEHVLKEDPSTHRFESYGYRPLECIYCRKPEGVHRA